MNVQSGEEEHVAGRAAELNLVRTQRLIWLGLQLRVGRRDRVESPAMITRWTVDIMDEFIIVLVQ